MNKKIALLLVFVLSQSICSAQSLFDNKEKEPIFLSSINSHAYDLDHYVYTRFDYPKDQMMDRYVTSVGVKMTINKEGTVVSADVTDSDLHDSVTKQLISLLKKTVWSPAKKDGRAVAFQLERRVFIVNPFSLVPKNAERVFSKVIPFLSAHQFKECVTEEDLGKLMDLFSEMYDQYPLSIEINIPYAVLLARSGQLEKACDVLNMGMKEVVTTSDNGKAEINAKMLLGMFYSLQGQVTEAKAAYKDMQNIIDYHLNGIPLGAFISTEYVSSFFKKSSMFSSKILHTDKTTYWTESDKDLMISQNAFFVRNRLNTEYLQRKWHKKLFYDGKKNQKHVFYQKVAEGTLSDSDFKLLALRALSIGLCDGKPVEDEWLKNLINDETPRDVAKKIEELRTKVKSDVASFDTIMQNIVTYAPIRKAKESKSACKARVKTFYCLRDEINTVYPIEWLIDRRDLSQDPFYKEEF